MHQKDRDKDDDLKLQYYMIVQENNKLQSKLNINKKLLKTSNEEILRLNQNIRKIENRFEKPTSVSVSEIISKNPIIH